MVKVKPLTCGECGKNIKGGLTSFKRHIKLHRGVKEFQCLICHRAFAQKSTLLTHQIVHSDLKNFICECSKTFKHRSSLKKHWKKGKCGAKESGSSSSVSSGSLASSEFSKSSLNSNPEIPQLNFGISRFNSSTNDALTEDWDSRFSNSSNTEDWDSRFSNSSNTEDWDSRFSDSSNTEDWDSGFSNSSNDALIEDWDVKADWDSSFSNSTNDALTEDWDSEFINSTNVALAEDWDRSDVEMESKLDPVPKKLDLLRQLERMCSIEISDSSKDWTNMDKDSVFPLDRLTSSPDPIEWNSNENSSNDQPRRKLTDFQGTRLDWLTSLPDPIDYLSVDDEDSPMENFLNSKE